MKKGFTIIELLIVIAIIGILAAIITISYTRSKARARDSIRISDLNSVAQAILIYKEATGVYPSNICPTGSIAAKTLSHFSTPCSDKPNGSLTVLVGGKYISSLPHDPKFNLASPTSDYWYFNDTVPASMRGPILAAKLELTRSGGWVYPGPFDVANPIETDCKMKPTTTTITDISGVGSTTTTYSDPLRYCVKVEL